MTEREYPQGKDAWIGLPMRVTQDRLDVGSFQVMQRWEEPLMQALADQVTQRRGDVLEIGFGMGISADRILHGGCRTYTVIEAHPEIAESARAWAERQSVPVTVHEGFWQDVAPKLPDRFDAILFDTYPVSQEEWTTFHLEFVDTARGLLRPGGIFAYFAGQTVRFSPDHTEILLTYFDEVRLIKVSDLAVPADCDYWKLDYMVLAAAIVHDN